VNFNIFVWMKNDDKIVELLSEMIFRQDRMIEEFKLMNLEIQNLQKQKQITNVSIIELRTSVMRLAD